MKKIKINAKTMEIIGTAATVIGIAANCVSGWVSENKMNERIKAEVRKEMAKTRR